MSTAVPCQRWRARRDSYRPAGEPIRTADHEVAVLDDDATAKAFVVAHHYSGSYPAARFRVGLFRRGALAGVAVFSIPCAERVLDVLPCGRGAGVELGRFVLLDEVEANGETWFLARALRLLAREGFGAVLSHSDPAPRATAAGAVVFGGHVGTIYQASSATYLGAGPRRTQRLLPDGSVFSARAWSKVRAREKGWRYSSEILVRHGAAAPPREPSVEQLRAWLALWLPRLTRSVRHPGMHRYAFALDRASRRLMPASLAFPKAKGGLS